eukprot:CAMPEP_0183713276 /NCGR_PEP_ID=MMETSP0737-20130205/8165_1 /TAXON_ID=385413 /ORGANISM="Thalassiosira miniscula, Strain CCMP1093" /LENGTH=281 /DNA_ID=CAMNT_0025942037 /DNA_START=146 /DNA_END=994 /DNA_ORIENTATION=+
MAMVEMNKQICECDVAPCDEAAHSHKESPRGIKAELLKIMKSQNIGKESDQVAFVNELCDLNKILDRRVHLAVWRQANSPKFVTSLSVPSIEPESLPVFEGMVLPGMAAEMMKKYLWVPYNLRSQKNRKRALDEEEIDELVTHIEGLVEVFASISQQAGFLSNDGEQLPFVYVKLQVIGDNACKFWHQDCVPLRMVTTYRGPSTEWVPPVFSKETLKQRQSDSKHAQSLSQYDVALFKGCGYEDSGRRDHPGIVHRSPQTEGTGIHRLVLILDIPQEDWHF